MENIRNIVLDLGGVLYAIDPEKAFKRFHDLHVLGDAVHPEKWVQQHQWMFDELEKGTVSPIDFRNYLRETAGIVGDDAALDQAWNALLVGVIPGRTDDLERLARNYRLILLSNTNIIHQEAIKEECIPLFGMFERIFFSFDMGMRKPDPKIYMAALEKMGMDPSESVFVDDNLENVNGSILAGLKGHYVSGHSEGDWRAFMLLMSKEIV
jgi:putative hydrolase of the HAD superfamily